MSSWTSSRAFSARGRPSSPWQEPSRAVRGPLTRPRRCETSKTGPLCQRSRALMSGQVSRARHHGASPRGCQRRDLEPGIPVPAPRLLPHPHVVWRAPFSAGTPCQPAGWIWRGRSATLSTSPGSQRDSSAPSADAVPPLTASGMRDGNAWDTDTPECHRIV